MMLSPFNRNLRTTPTLAWSPWHRELWHYKKYLSFELEGQVAKHFNKDTQWEFVGVLIGRWHYFPWNKYVDTSFAVGDGMSYYTEVSEVEKEDDEDAQRALNYLLFEVALGLPEYPKWDLVFRIHHRSSVFGLVWRRRIKFRLWWN